MPYRVETLLVYPTHVSGLEILGEMEKDKGNPFSDPKCPYWRLNQY